MASLAESYPLALSQIAEAIYSHAQVSLMEACASIRKFFRDTGVTACRRGDTIAVPTAASPGRKLTLDKFKVVSRRWSLGDLRALHAGLAEPTIDLDATALGRDVLNEAHKAMLAAPATATQLLDAVAIVSRPVEFNTEKDTVAVASGAVAGIALTVHVEVVEGNRVMVCLHTLFGIAIS